MNERQMARTHKINVIAHIAVYVTVSALLLLAICKWMRA